MQQSLVEYNRDKSEEEQILLCVGIGYGRVLRIGDVDVFGHEVNSASKLGEDTAKAYEILVTPAVREEFKESSDFRFDATEGSHFALHWRLEQNSARL
jgi:class 3 adenylate cyclase